MLLLLLFVQELGQYRMLRIQAELPHSRLYAHSEEFDVGSRKL